MKIIDKYNSIVGTIIALLNALLGTFWYIFFAYFTLNLIDWLTGWYKARLAQKETSKAGLVGVLKKLGYWAIIAVAFLISEIFVRLGKDILGMNLDFLSMIGWITLSMLMVNEARSILENLVECGYHVPSFLVRGLSVTQKLIEAGVKIPEDEERIDKT